MLLQSLIYLFQADTSDLDRSIRDSERGADDLSDALREAEERAKKTADTFKTFLKGAVGWLGAAASAGEVMSMAIQRAGEVDALDTLSLQLGTSITKTDALARSIVGLGGSTDQAQADLGALADALKESGQEPLEGMLQLSDQLAGMSYDQATRELKEYGITEESTIELLRKGGAEIERMIKHQERNGAITQEAADKAKQFNQSLTQLDQSLAQLKQMASDVANKFVQMLMPALTVVVDFLAKVGKRATKNKPFVVGFFAAVAGIIATMFLPAMLSAAAATIAATWPFIAIGAAIAAAAALFAIIYDDIMTFIDGGESMIGMILEKFPVIGEVVTWLWETMKLAFGSIVGLGETLLSGLSSMADGIVGVFQWLWSMIKKYLDFVGGAIDKVKGAVSWIAGKLGFGEIEVKSTQEDEDFAKRFAIKDKSEDDLMSVKTESKNESREENTARFDTADRGIGRTTDIAEPKLEQEVVEPKLEQDIDTAKKSVEPKLEQEVVEPRLEQDIDKAKSIVEPKLEQEVVEPRLEQDIDKAKKSVEPRLEQDIVEPRLEQDIDKAKSIVEPRLEQDVDTAKKSVEPKLEQEVVEPRLDREVDRAKSIVEPRIDKEVIAAQVYIKAAEESPAASMTTGAIRNAATGNQIEQNLAIGEITIETQATDAQGIASSTRSELQDQLQRMQADNATAITR